MSDVSSDEDCLSASKTYLGFIDVEISEEEVPSIEDSFIGGQPLWLGGVPPKSKTLLNCKNCGDQLVLLLQTFAPLPTESQNDRVLYLFGCKKHSCNRRAGSIRCLKGLIRKKKQVLLEEKLKEEEEQNYGIKLSKGLFGNNDSVGDQSDNEPANKTSNPFDNKSKNPFDKKSSNPFDNKSSNLFDKLSLDSKKKDDRPTQTETVEEDKNKLDETQTTSEAKSEEEYKLNQEYPGYILYVEKEKLGSDDDILPPLPKNVQIEEDENLDDSSKYKPITSGKVSEFTSDVLKDKEFQNFSKICAHNPSQVLRYELNGEPLIYSSKDKFKISKAEEIRDKRYELQLMPKAIIDLEVNLIDSLSDGMEWGTILVYTQVNDENVIIIGKDKTNNDVGYVEEKVVVEWEDPLDFSQKN